MVRLKIKLFITTDIFFLYRNNFLYLKQEILLTIPAVNENLKADKVYSLKCQVHIIGSASKNFLLLLYALTL